MKKLLICAVALTVMLGAPMYVDAADDDKTLTGEPVDITCFLGGRSGAGHASCATSCANNGQPIGLLVTEGEEKNLYLVLGTGGKQAKDLLAAHMGKQVKVTGKVSTKNGLKTISASAVSDS